LGEEELKNDKTVIFPNPATEQFTIQGVQGTIEIYDMTGKLLKQIENYNGEKISIIDLSEGLYTVQFTSNNELVSKKLMVD